MNAVIVGLAAVVAVHNEMICSVFTLAAGFMVPLIRGVSLRASQGAAGGVWRLGRVAAARSVPLVPGMGRSAIGRTRCPAGPGRCRTSQCPAPGPGSSASSVNSLTCAARALMSSTSKYARVLACPGPGRGNPGVRISANQAAMNSKFRGR